MRNFRLVRFFKVDNRSKVIGSITHDERDVTLLIGTYIIPAFL